MQGGWPSQRPRGHKPVGLLMDATDKEAHAPRSCGRSVIELYKDDRPHSAIGYKVPFTVEQMMADQRQADAEKGADEIPPEITQQLMRDHLDRHYRETLDEPLPVLGGKSPRQAAGTPAGRKKVIGWLKYLENRSTGHAEGPIADDDFGWMWDELDLDDHRK